jgi:NADP-dependent 3-hydroxy acid dehydrogenase YdfG
MCAMTSGAVTPGQTRVALVTGASSGIGAATVRALAAAGFETVAAARRVERCEELAREVGGRALPLDVTDDASVAALAAALDRVDVVVHSAGGALGLDPIESGDVDQWRRMYDANVLGVLRVHQALLPKLRAGGNGHVVVLGSIAGYEVYPGGAGYTGVKHAVNALCRTLRLELVGEPIRITEVAPGMVETEFSLVRFDGDRERADAVYRGLTPLTAEDVAEVVAFCVTRPPHVDVDYVVIKPVAQASATVSARRDT